MWTQLIQGECTGVTTSSTYDDSKALQDRVRRLSADLKDLKHNQTIGGDSWVVYRHEATYVKPQPNYGVVHTQPIFQIDFIPNEDGPFVALAIVTISSKAFQADEQDVYPDPNYYGRWYDCGTTGAGGSTTVMVFSTKKGVVRVSPPVWN